MDAAVVVGDGWKEDRERGDERKGQRQTVWKEERERGEERRGEG